MKKYRVFLRAAVLGAMFIGAQFAVAQNEWLDENYRRAQYPREEWYVGFSQDRVTAGIRVAEAIRRVERDAQNRLVETIIVRIEATSESGTTSARTESGGQARERVSRRYEQQVMATASAEIANAETFSHHDPETNTVSAFIAVRRTDLADYYASQIETGLVEAERLFELFEQQVELGRRIEALERLSEALARVETLDYYRDLLVAIDTQNGRERSQGDRVNDIIRKITVAQNTYERPKIVAVISRAELTEAQMRIVKSKFLEPFTASNLYSVISRPDLFLQRRILDRVRRSSGALNMDEVYKVALENEATYVCVIEILNAGNGFHVTARIISSETGNVFGSPGSADISTLDDIDYAANEIFKRIHINVGNLNDGNVMTDPRDGKIYRTVEIGGRVWMAENLNFAATNSWCYNEDESNCRRFGRLYTWESAVGACPGGWSLPRRRDWDELVRHAGGWRSAGERLKSKAHWNGTDEFGFSALPAGGRSSTGNGFALMGDNAFFWSATETDRETAHGRGVESLTRIIGEGNNRKSSGFSVRCVQNEE